MERQNGQTKLYFISGIINPLFDGLTNNTRAHFAHCKMRHCVLYVKPSNKVYFLTNSSYIFLWPQFVNRRGSQWSGDF